MEIEDVIFTDGRFLATERRNKDFIVRFCDYSGHTLELIFTGEVRVVKEPEIGFDVSDWKLISTESSLQLCLFDDEGNCTGDLRFDHAFVSLIE